MRGGGAEWFAADPPPYINSIAAAAAQMPAATRKKEKIATRGASPRRLGRREESRLFTAGTHRTTRRRKGVRRSDTLAGFCGEN